MRELLVVGTFSSLLLLRASLRHILGRGIGGGLKLRRSDHRTKCHPDAPTSSELFISIWKNQTTYPNALETVAYGFSLLENRQLEIDVHLLAPIICLKALLVSTAVS